jgi:hypothetical protein
VRLLDATAAQASLGVEITSYAMRALLAAARA